MKRVLDVGNCDPDHSSISAMITGNFDAEIVRAHGHADAIESLRNGSFDLVMVNRTMDHDGSSGLEIIQAIKSNEATQHTPVVMITNFEEHQQAAMAAGANRGFGKTSLATDETLDTLRPFLG